MSQDDTLIFGFLEDQLAFASKYKPLAEGLVNIKRACDAAIFNAPMDNLEERVLSFLAYQVFEDFREVFILCTNGLANGARKILRGMCERTVYLLYLEGHRDQIELYFHYYWIDRFKRAERLQLTLHQDQREELDEMYEKFKKDYQVPVCRACKIEGCEDCKKTRLNHTWSKMDLVTMAKKVGLSDHLLEVAYFIPMEETHPKVGAIFRRVKSSEGGSHSYDDSPHANDEKTPMFVAHFFLLSALDVVNNNLGVEALADPLKLCWTDFQKTWEPFGLSQP